MSVVLDLKNVSVKLDDKVIVENSSFTVRKGECLGILGESGSGKSMTVKAVLGLLDKNFETSGVAIFNGENLLNKSKESLRNIRGKDITMVLQNPMTCFDPLYRIGNQMAETFKTHTNWSNEEIYKNSLDILNRMKIRDGEEVLKKYPHQISGGMLQRIMIGIAMAMKPKLLIADEPTTAIDAITQYEIMQEFQKIKEEHETAMIFITHDLGAVSLIADDIVVMNNGKIVERGDFNHIIHNSKDSYTRLLVEKRISVMKKYREVVYREEV
ncbi:MAG: ABC transporter ATP-binding protein [Tyzzerella sp.]|uniref:ABC transporter ATP-binding protein n=1 Tax=Candidatus Fimicola merdigallinarum TaxID=2840819 RepID=A0A9D9H3V9_9FIRM|nr:ABC transporter ATP-binding protein [Candidatus Fimicola merdigallinarum]